MFHFHLLNYTFELSAMVGKQLRSNLACPTSCTPRPQHYIHSKLRSANSAGARNPLAPIGPLLEDSALATPLQRCHAVITGSLCFYLALPAPTAGPPRSGCWVWRGHDKTNKTHIHTGWPTRG